MRPLGTANFPHVTPGAIGDGYTGTVTFYAATTTGGSPTQLQTVVIRAGLITGWTQTSVSGTGGGYQFDDADNSGWIHAMG